MRQVRAILHEQLDPRRNGVLLVHGQAMPPLSELVGLLNFPGHESIVFLSGNNLQYSSATFSVRSDEAGRRDSVESGDERRRRSQARNRNQGGYESN